MNWWFLLFNTVNAALALRLAYKANSKIDMLMFSIVACIWAMGSGAQIAFGLVKRRDKQMNALVYNRLDRG